MDDTMGKINELQLLRQQHDELRAENEKLRQLKQANPSSVNEGHENQSSSSTETELNNNFDRKWADIDKRINLAIRQKYNELKQYSMRKNLSWDKFVVQHGSSGVSTDANELF